MVTASTFPSFVDELPLTRRALDYAALRHGDQRRDSDHAAFILHPLEVAQLLRNRGYPDHVVAAAVLHDVIENTAATVAELERRFGGEVAGLVAAVTEPADGSYGERKERLREAISHAGPEAAAVYAADKVTRVRELRLSLARDWSVAAQPGTAAKLDHYWASLALLEQQLAGNPLVAQLRFELETLALLPPAASAD